MTSRAAHNFEAVAGLWEKAFRKNGATPHQSPGNIRAELLRNGPREVTIIETGGALSAFRKLGGTWVFLLEGAGALLSLKDCIVTVDALHYHRAMARSLFEAGGQ